MGESQKWYQAALKNSKTGSDLQGVLIGSCDKRPGLSNKVVEEKILEAVKHGSDANLLLFDLYLTRECGAFSLEKATSTIPMLSQCAYLAIDDYFRISREMNFHIEKETLLNINKNIDLCWQEISNPSIRKNQIGEIMAPREEFLRDFAALVNSMQH